MSEQFLTAIFELRPSRRKAAILERVRSVAESAFWTALEKTRALAETAIDVDRKERRAILTKIENDAMKIASAMKLSESVAAGVARDVGAAAASYVGLKASGHAAQWPVPRIRKETDFSEALTAMASAISLSEENAARDELTRVSRNPLPRPFSITRNRDGLIARKHENGSLVAILNVMRATDSGSRAVEIADGFDAANGVAFKANKSKTRLVIPISCSKWHENKFLSGKAVLKSSQISRVGSRWFMNAQFCFTVKDVATKAVIGIDRGIANMISAATIDLHGGVKKVLPISGNDVALAIQKSERKAKAFQRRTGRSIPLHHRAANHILHNVANRIIAEAKSQNAQIVFEKLTGLKKTITVKRTSGARRNPWAKSLKAVQMGKIEQMLIYKSALAGLPEPKDVMAAGTSITCSCCGHMDKNNRKTQDLFICEGCGFTVHADMNASVQIGRRGIMKVSKGDKLNTLHSNMVAKLKNRDDGGLGPLAAGVAKGLVAVHITTGGAYAKKGRKKPDVLTPSVG